RRYASSPTLPLHDALPILNCCFQETVAADAQAAGDTEQTIVNEPGLRGCARSSRATAGLEVPQDYILDGAVSAVGQIAIVVQDIDRKSTRLNSSHGSISYA